MASRLLWRHAYTTCHFKRVRSGRFFHKMSRHYRKLSYKPLTFWQIHNYGIYQPASSNVATWKQVINAHSAYVHITWTFGVYAYNMDTKRVYDTLFLNWMFWHSSFGHGDLHVSVENSSVLGIEC